MNGQYWPLKSLSEGFVSSSLGGPNLADAYTPMQPSCAREVVGTADLK